MQSISYVEETLRVSDEEILDMIKKGLIYYENGNVYKWHFSHRRYEKLKFRINQGRYVYQLQIKSNRKNKKRTIQANKLIYIIVNKEIPKGDVDHRDEDKLNNHPDNLQDLSRSKNRRKNTKNGFESCCKFFDRVVARRYNSLGDF